MRIVVVNARGVKGKDYAGYLDSIKASLMGVVEPRVYQQALDSGNYRWLPGYEQCPKDNQAWPPGGSGWFVYTKQNQRCTSPEHDVLPEKGKCTCRNGDQSNAVSSQGKCTCRNGDQSNAVSSQGKCTCRNGDQSNAVSSQGKCTCRNGDQSNAVSSQGKCTCRNGDQSNAV